MHLRIEVNVGGRNMFIGRRGENWIVSDKQDTEERGAATLETDGRTYGIYDSALEFNKMMETYAHIEPCECN